MIAAVRRAVSLPLIVGGGLRSAADVETALQAGADIVVVGTSIESNYALVEEIARAVVEFSR